VPAEKGWYLHSTFSPRLKIKALLNRKKSPPFSREREKQSHNMGLLARVKTHCDEMTYKWRDTIAAPTEKVWPAIDPKKSLLLSADHSRREVTLRA